MEKRVLKVAGILVVAMILGCNSMLDVGDEVDAKQLVQLGQDAYDRSNLKAAIYYYDTLIKRFGTNPALYVEGRYEIAHIYIKQRKYDEARVYLEEITSIYKDTPPGVLPGAFGKLAAGDLERIKGKKSKRR